MSHDFFVTYVSGRSQGVATNARTYPCTVWLKSSSAAPSDDFSQLAIALDCGAATHLPMVRGSWIATHYGVREDKSAINALLDGDVHTFESLRRHDVVSASVVPEDSRISGCSSVLPGDVGPERPTPTSTSV